MRRCLFGRRHAHHELPERPRAPLGQITLTNTIGEVQTSNHGTVPTNFGGTLETKLPSGY